MYVENNKRVICKGMVYKLNSKESCLFWTPDEDRFCSIGAALNVYEGHQSISFPVLSLSQKGKEFGYYEDHSFGASIEVLVTSYKWWILSLDNFYCFDSPSGVSYVFVCNIWEQSPLSRLKIEYLMQVKNWVLDALWDVSTYLRTNFYIVRLQIFYGVHSWNV